MLKVKICGISQSRHLKVAVEFGAAYVGFVFFNKSPRNLTLEKAHSLSLETPPGICKVALLVNPDDIFIDNLLNRIPIDMLQLHGSESPERVAMIKSKSRLPVMKAIGVSSESDLIQVKAYADVADQILLDAKPPSGSTVPGGNGRSFDWRILTGFSCAKPWFLAGGLNAENVNQALNLSGATQLDVSSGVEDKFGNKSETKISEFLSILKGA